MIVVFVVDTSPSMGRPALGDSGLSRLDVAKIAVEDFHRQWRRARAAATADQQQQRSYGNLGQLLATTAADQFLLLSTSRQHAETAACAAGGRLLVGFGSGSSELQLHQQARQQESHDPALHHAQQSVEAFQRELKRLKVAVVDTPSKQQPWPEEAGGAAGLNAALSAGLELLSRYRLLNRQTENFGMGRLPNTAIPTLNGTPAAAALQPACLVLVRACVCVSECGWPADEGHIGTMKMSHPLFRWLPLPLFTSLRMARVCDIHQTKGVVPCSFITVLNLSANFIRNPFGGISESLYRRLVRGKD
jgi:hypothetical protein